MFATENIENTFPYYRHATITYRPWDVMFRCAVWEVNRYGMRGPGRDGRKFRSYGEAVSFARRAVGLPARVGSMAVTV